MVVVAIAGGTGGVGRTVLDAIAESGEHNAIVLSRTVSSPKRCSFRSNPIQLTLSRQRIPPQPTRSDVFPWITTT